MCVQNGRIKRASNKTQKSFKSNLHSSNFLCLKMTETIQAFATVAKDFKKVGCGVRVENLLSEPLTGVPIPAKTFLSIC